MATTIDDKATRFLVLAAFRAKAIDSTDFEFLTEHPERYGEVTEFVNWLAGSNRTATAPFAKDDILRLTFRHRDGEETYDARVSTAVERDKQDDGWHFGYVPTEPGHCAWGYATAFDKPRPFCLVAWERIGHAGAQPQPTLPNLFRNPGYDLCHDPDPRFY